MRSPAEVGCLSVLSRSNFALNLIIAALFLIPLQAPPLTTVRFTNTAFEDAKLITHSQGYWYVIKQGDDDVTALPDEVVGTATISRP
jgi:hypothetical protein